VRDYRDPNHLSKDTPVLVGTTTGSNASIPGANPATGATDTGLPTPQATDNMGGGSGNNGPPKTAQGFPFPEDDPTGQQQAADLLKNGQGARGCGGNNLPAEGGPTNGVLYKVDPKTGKVTNYTTYDSNGRALKRVDLDGRPHGGIDTPHVVEYVHNKNLKTGEVFVRQSNQVRKTFPWEEL
jgi:hypothetical protein